MKKKTTMKTTVFLVTKKVYITHDKGWAKDELLELAKDVCTMDGQHRDWDMTDVEFYTITRNINEIVE